MARHPAADPEIEPTLDPELTGKSHASDLAESDPLAADDADVADLYSAEYLHACADEDARQERIAELRRRIEAGAYQIDADRIAEEILVRGDVS